MIIIGIESTAHTLGVGIIKVKYGKLEILSNERSLFTTTEGGMIPAKVAEHHIDSVDALISKSLDVAGVNATEIDLISYSESPGLGHCLRIGAMIAKTLSVKLNKPLVGVNHCIAHLEIGRIVSGAKNPILLYVSGANTQVVAYESGRYRIFGESLDGGIGNFLDSFARVLGLGFPGGPKIDKLAKKGREYIALPYVVKGMDVSFGGILTNLKQKIKSEKFKIEDLCYSAQETVFSMMMEVAERAMAHCDKGELLLGGGVACNSRLQEMSYKMCEDRGAKCYVLKNSLNVDNGVMIAWLGYLMFNKNNKKGIKLSDAVIRPYIRTDDVDVYWR